LTCVELRYLVGYHLQDADRGATDLIWRDATTVMQLLSIEEILTELQDHQNQTYWQAATSLRQSDLRSFITRYDPIRSAKSGDEEYPVSPHFRARVSSLNRRASLPPIFDDILIDWYLHQDCAQTLATQSIWQPVDDDRYEMLVQLLGTGVAADEGEFIQVEWSIRVPDLGLSSEQLRQARLHSVGIPYEIDDFLDPIVWIACEEEDPGEKPYLRGTHLSHTETTVSPVGWQIALPEDVESRVVFKDVKSVLDIRLWAGAICDEVAPEWEGAVPALSPATFRPRPEEGETDRIAQADAQDQKTGVQRNINLDEEWQLPPPTEMKKHYSDYSEPTARIIIESFPEAYELWDFDGQWGPSIIAEVCGWSADTVGRYLGALKKAGIDTVNGMQIPHKHR
jgi:hypothetical protein